MSLSVPFPSVQNTTISNQDAENQRQNSYIDVNESSFNNDTEQELHHMKSKIMDNTWTDQATPVALDTSVHNKSSPLHSNILSLNNTPDDRLVLVPLSMLSLNRTSMTNAKSTKEPNLQASMICNTISLYYNTISL